MGLLWLARNVPPASSPHHVRVSEPASERGLGRGDGLEDCLIRQSTAAYGVDFDLTVILCSCENSEAVAGRLLMWQWIPYRFRPFHEPALSVEGLRVHDQNCQVHCFQGADERAVLPHIHTFQVRACGSHRDMVPNICTKVGPVHELGAEVLPELAVRKGADPNGCVDALDDLARRCPQRVGKESPTYLYIRHQHTLAALAMKLRCSGHGPWSCCPPPA